MYKVLRYSDGSEAWFKDDGDNRLLIMWNVGSYELSGQQWLKDGKLHRDGDLPAYICGGVGKWYKEGMLHRDIGPTKTNPPRFFERGVERSLDSSRGETLVERSLTSWSPVLCFI